MGLQDISMIERAIAYMEAHLDEKMDFERVAGAVHYSKYHLHRMFTEITGMTLHDYMLRRQMTEAAAFLSFVRTFVLLAAAILILPKLLGIIGVWLAVPAAECTACIVSGYSLPDVSPSTRLVQRCIITV